MGRSRGNFHSDEDPTQRSRRKKNASSGENPDSSSSGQGTSEGKRALYHCNYCNKDITGKIRIKCAMCPDFDLCVECFSVGAEVTPHKSNHPYRVMDNLSFPLICPDWNADDEILLLEGIEMYGLGNWTEVAEHVGTKSKEQCIDHYSTVYLNSPCFPLPDMTHVVGKNRKELLAMAKGQGDDKKGSTMPGEPVKEESPFSPSRVKAEEVPTTGPSGRLPSSSTADLQTDRSSKGKKSITPRNDGPSLVELSGYNPKRREFDTEYDNDAEQLLADMEFKDTDTEDERELKIRVLHIYSRRLDERQRRKDFILERNLLYPSPFQRSLSPEERALCKRYDVYMRFHTKEEHDELLQSIVAEHRTKKRIAELKEAQAAGCRTSAEADRYLEQKRRREAEEASRKARDSASAGTGGQGGPNALSASESASRDSHPTKPAGPASTSRVNEFDMTSFYNTFLLSEADKRLCNEIRLAPPAYLKMQEAMAREILNGNITKKSDAHPLFQLDPSKVDKVYDMLVKKGISQP
ncbi:transcriptional adapter ADA2b-like isoform X1 [Tripterygium wilfordii]|uniref:Transcriptional adapter n=1 Tax=Tripterygium wilfordii TaxID=458696 RepID=A0A7J7CTK1_TRIWF|nr:transcriptional adapter ADA2b-like isoform X2 [Tripterygium wilfordii]KAF5737328.1 transcriptional adapter ADA2b-like isoform X1 [Tripterygium wilfordii]